VITPARVLLLGTDQRLLDARARVLGHFWLVATALATEPAPELARSLEPADVVVLSECLSERQRHLLVKAIHDLSPDKVQVQMDEIDAGPIGGLDAMVAVGNGPGALVATIYGLLVERGLASKGWSSLEITLLDDATGPVH
jgi:hypothetical protein